jgi:hypothetical protein
MERACLVGDDHVRERASGVDGDAETHQLRTVARRLSVS